MKKIQQDRFRFDWVLRNELAVGPAPRNEKHLIILENKCVASVLTLCSENEVIIPDQIKDKFVHRRSVLPDHTTGRLPTLDELITTLNTLKELKKSGAVFVHCVASVERSPLVCMAWLIREHSMSPTQALDYLMQVHQGTNPLPGQLALLKEI